MNQIIEFMWWLSIEEPAVALIIIFPLIMVLAIVVRERHANYSACMDSSPRAHTVSFRWYPQGIDTDSIKSKKQQTINDKAMKLLKEKIGNELFKSLEDKGHFDVIGKEGTYRFFKSDKVELTQTRKFIGNKERTLTWNLCIESKVRDMPIGDVILARYLMLKVDEAKFLNTANFRSVETIDEYNEIGELGEFIQARAAQAMVNALRERDNELLMGGGQGRPLGISGKEYKIEN